MPVLPVLSVFVLKEPEPLPVFEEPEPPFPPEPLLLPLDEPPELLPVDLFVISTVFLIPSIHLPFAST